MRKTRLTPGLHRLVYRAIQDIRQRCTDRDNKDLRECGGRGRRSATSPSPRAHEFELGLLRPREKVSAPVDGPVVAASLYVELLLKQEET